MEPRPEVSFDGSCSIRAQQDHRVLDDQRLDGSSPYEYCTPPAEYNCWWVHHEINVTQTTFHGCESHFVHWSLHDFKLRLYILREIYLYSRGSLNKSKRGKESGYNDHLARGQKFRTPGFMIAGRRILGYKLLGFGRDNESKVARQKC